MGEALSLAMEAYDAGEIPVGCVIVKDGKIIGRGRNRREATGSALAHAELEAISQACSAVGGWRLSGTQLYVTLEPCPMCAGAILNARIPELFYGAREEHTGSCGSVINIFMENYGFSPKITGGVLETRCAAPLRDFFAQIRDSK